MAGGVTAAFGWLCDLRRLFLSTWCGHSGRATTKAWATEAVVLVWLLWLHGLWLTSQASGQWRATFLKPSRKPLPCQEMLGCGPGPLKLRCDRPQGPQHNVAAVFPRLGAGLPGCLKALGSEAKPSR